MKPLSFAASIVPKPIKNRLKRNRLWLRHSSTNVNVYHCCVHKTASQWFQALMCDSRIYRYSGLTLCPNGTVPRGGYKAVDTKNLENFSVLFPKKTLATSLHISFPNFQLIPKPEHYKAFFVMRDPRDIVTSYYFSAKHSHVLTEGLIKQRKKLQEISEVEGIILSMEYLSEYGLFSALESWIDAPKIDSNVRLFKFEELMSSENFEIFKELFSYCDIPIPDKLLTELLKEYSFKKLTNREAGKEEKLSHLRKGIAGDWKNHFNDRIYQRFNELTGDLVSRLGY